MPLLAPASTALRPFQSEIQLCLPMSLIIDRTADCFFRCSDHRVFIRQSTLAGVGSSAPAISREEQKIRDEDPGYCTVPQDLAFREEVRTLPRREVHAGTARGGAASVRRLRRAGRTREALAQDPVRAGLDRAVLAARNTAARAGRRCSATSSPTNAPRPARRPCRPWACRCAGRCMMGYGTAEQKALLPAAHPVGRALLVPGLFRAAVGLRPRLAADARGARRRRLCASTARRSGRRTPSSPTGCSCWCARRPRARPQAGITLPAARHGRRRA